MPTSGPFDEDERAAIRNFLGFSELFRDIDTRLEGQMDTIGDSRPAAAARVRKLLTKLAEIDDMIQGASEDNLDLRTAEDGVTFLGPEQIAALQELGAAYINQMSIIFEVEPQRPYYGGGALGGPIALG